MNQRIQELAIEAENYADGIVDQGGEFHQTYTKKFAELIVRECSAIAAKNQAEDMEWDISGIIKEHFGIEE